MEKKSKYDKCKNRSLWQQQLRWCHMVLRDAERQFRTTRDAGQRALLSERIEAAIFALYDIENGLGDLAAPDVTEPAVAVGVTGTEGCGDCAIEWGLWTTSTLFTSSTIDLRINTVNYNLPLDITSAEIILNLPERPSHDRIFSVSFGTKWMAQVKSALQDRRSEVPGADGTVALNEKNQVLGVPTSQWKGFEAKLHVEATYAPDQKVPDNVTNLQTLISNSRPR